jgi:DNA topoisomerase I
MENNFEISAKAAKLSYVCIDDPGYVRKRAGKGFIYLDENGKRIKNKKLLERFKSLVIPPAWNEVWICAKQNGHIQVTGRDAKERKQYIYHPDWDEVRNTNKFGRMIEFGKNLPSIRKKVEKDLRKKTLTQEKVLAAIVRLLEETLIRVGNAEYAKTNKSYGLTTLKDNHIKIKGSAIKFSFKGKSGKDVDADFKDKRLAKIVKDCQDIPGQHLFQYYDDEGKRFPVTSGDVNEYLNEICGKNFTAKDFRTWGGTITAAEQFYLTGKAENEKESAKNIVKVVKEVAAALNNTPAICREYYIHPHIVEAYKDGYLFKIFPQPSGANGKAKIDLSREEKAVLKILKKYSE